MSGSARYFREIDGLRALAVIAITLFHLRVAGFAGGFVGVDVFFVISGFLITGIIVGHLGRQQFRFGDFYRRRAARILPALLVTVLVALVAAAWLQQPSSLVDSAWQAIWATLSLSNFYFWSEASYWARASEELLLLHTWSLGVEEQFYLGYPLLMYFAHRIAGPRGIAALLVLLVVAGTAANFVVGSAHPPTAFYWSPLRIYEFALGGLGVLLYERCSWLRDNRVLAGAATLLGLLLIILSIVFLLPIQHVLGLLMLVPCLGTLLVILAGASAPARLLLANPVSRWLGKLSYAIYLVHWPILVLYRDQTGATLSATEQVALLGAVITAAYLLHILVENRFRLKPSGDETRHGLPWSRVLAGVLVLAIANIGVASWLISARGLPQRYPPSVHSLLQVDYQARAQALNQLAQAQCGPRKGPFCGRREQGRRTLWLLGDSRGPGAYLALRQAYPEANIIASWSIGCAPVLDEKASISPFSRGCHGFNLRRLERVLRAPSRDAVFLVQDYLPFRTDATFDTARRLAEGGKQVYLLGEFEITDGKRPLDIMIEAARQGDTDSVIRRYLVARPFGDDDSFARRARDVGAAYISLRDLFYQDGYRFQPGPGEDLLTYDGKHLSRSGARLLGQHLGKSLPDPWRVRA